ncbi:MAG: hypothetical protein Q7U76_11310 [Nitrospirota bacterium]|nr:hypothetical protein [Nitrospirota bacterium]
MKLPARKGPASATVAPGASATLIERTNADNSGHDVYLRKLGTGIDPTSNAAYATQQLLVNGVPHSEFGNITSQLGSISQPETFELPYYLGRSVSVAMKGVMAAGASGNTEMAAMFELILMTPGERP